MTNEMNEIKERVENILKNLTQENPEYEKYSEELEELKNFIESKQEFPHEFANVNPSDTLLYFIDSLLSLVKCNWEEKKSKKYTIIKFFKK